MKILVVISLLGLVGCASTSSLNEEVAKRKVLELKVASMEKKTVAMVKRILMKSKSEIVASIKNEVYAAINENMEKDKKFMDSILTNLNMKFSEYQEVVATLIAEQIVVLKGSVGVEVESALLHGDFIKQLEDRTAKKVIKETKAELNSEKKDIIAGCVESALDELIIKQIGVRDSGLKTVR